MSEKQILWQTEQDSWKIYLRFVNHFFPLLTKCVCRSTTSARCPRLSCCFQMTSVPVPRSKSTTTSSTSTVPSSLSRHCFHSMTLLENKNNSERRITLQLNSPIKHSPIQIIFAVVKWVFSHTSNVKKKKEEKKCFSIL